LPTVTWLQRTAGNQAVQRLFAVQRQEDEEEPAPVQTMPEADIGSQIQAQAGAGQALDSSVQRRLSEGMGADLSDVRVHTDSAADSLARSVDAHAFTSGSDIYFRQGAYDPHSATGMHVLAHEAAHVVQQASGPVAGTPTDEGIALSDPSDSFERAADASAKAALTET